MHQHRTVFGWLCDCERQRARLSRNAMSGLEGCRNRVSIIQRVLPSGTTLVDKVFELIFTTNIR